MKIDYQSLFFCLLPFLSLIACQATPPPQWQWERADASRGLPRQTIVTAVAADPTNSNRLWAGYYAPGGLARSDDGGQTWTMEAEGLGDNPVFDLLARSSVDNELELWAATRAGLRYSQDAGASWQPATGDLPPGTVFALATDEGGRLYVGLDEAGVYGQNGAGWIALSQNEPLATAAVLSLAVSAEGRQLYAGTSGRGVFASRDGGQQWVATYPGEYTPNVVLNPNDPDIAVASLRNRLVRTDDGGQSWHTIPLPWAGDEIVSLLWLEDGILGAGTGKGGLYLSLDDGDSWVENPAALTAGGGVLDLADTSRAHQFLAGTWTGVYASQNRGESWQYLSPSLGVPHAQTLLATESGLWLGTRAGLFRWAVDTQRWQPVTGEDAPSEVKSLASDPTNPHILYAGTSGRPLYRSDDAGETWQHLPSAGAGTPAIVIDPTDSNHLYRLAAWERVYESYDGGQSWQARWEGLGNTLETTSLLLDTAETGQPIVYVGSEIGLYRGQGNEDWELVAWELLGQSILTLTAQPLPPHLSGGAALYIGATRGAYRSLDGGQTVQSCEEGQGWGCGLEQISVTAFLLDEQHPSHLYAGTAYDGVYQSLDWGQTWQPLGPEDVAAEVIAAMAWGPEGDLFVITENGVWRGVRL